MLDRIIIIHIYYPNKIHIYYVNSICWYKTYNSFFHDNHFYSMDCHQFWQLIVNVNESLSFLRKKTRHFGNHLSSDISDNLVSAMFSGFFFQGSNSVTGNFFYIRILSVFFPLTWTMLSFTLSPLSVRLFCSLVTHLH